MHRRSVSFVCLLALVISCWGTAQAATPEIAAGGGHTLALKADGTL